MTKIEYGICEKLMEEAINNAKQADEEYADGIRQALATLGFTHDRMKELSKLL